MLIQFNFKNFRSFRDDTSLDMTATSITEHPYNLINCEDEKYIKVAAIYGANASGKSSVIEAFSFMRKWIRSSFEEGGNKDYIPLKRFAFDDKSLNEPAEFEVFFRYNNRDYQYGFSLDNTKIHEEWLYLKEEGSNNYIYLFEREHGEINCNEKLFKDAKNFIPMVESKTLFLSITSSAKIVYSKDVREWFTLPVIDYGSVNFERLLEDMRPFNIDDKHHQENLVEFLKAIDMNIEGIVVEKSSEDEGESEVKIYTKHLKSDGHSFYKLPLSEESSGTRKMFTLYQFIIGSLQFGLTLFIDELDSKLHPLLLRYILTMFHDENINKNGAQLIYSTHDNYTLTRDIFRRDQIWFVEKDRSAASHLYSLVEYKSEDDKKIRKDASYNKDYLLGKYGSVPVLRGYDMWGEEHGKTK